MSVHHDPSEASKVNFLRLAGIRADEFDRDGEPKSERARKYQNQWAHALGEPCVIQGGWAPRREKKRMKRDGSSKV